MISTQVSTEFSYFDQFSDMEIDLTKYLQVLSASTSASFNYTVTNLQPVKTNIKDLFTHYEFVINFKKDVSQLTQYNITDWELVEQVSYKMYDTTDFWWIVYLFNNITNPFEQWPMPQERVNTLANTMYNEEGLYSAQTYYNMVFTLNEDRRQILLPLANALPSIVWAFREQILKSTADYVTL
jgi:hypothetical protein